ncbi:MAG: methyltransferase [Bacteroidales bacterium]|nr:methyltransferase [Bacteroidales bacterium]
MKSTIFHFKQFSINQDKTAMKIGTDGVILGAWTNVKNAKNILDIGTGTGIISLASAQRSKANITAIEIEQNAYNQATENFNNSKFKNRITTIHDDFVNWSKKCTQKFDYIVSNPPFFQDSKKSLKINRTLARHTDSLPFSKLIKHTSEILEHGGYFSVIIPEIYRLDFVKLSISFGLHLCRKTLVKSFENTTPIRVLLEFTNTINPLIQNELVIYSQKGKYSEEFKNLTKDFYIE